MKKKEIRWLSRDDINCADYYEVWPEKPTSVGSVFANKETRTIKGRVSSGCVSNLGVIVKRGGLAKITIERQY